MGKIEDLGDGSDKVRQELFELSLIEAELTKRDKIGNPLNYGLPNLFIKKSKNETPEEFIQRQNKLIEILCTKYLMVDKDGIKKEIKPIPAQLEYLSDMFYGPVQRAVVWKSRGTGGSFISSVLIWLSMIYKQMSFCDIAGCLLPGTMVWTSRGFVCIENIVEGDTVFSKLGTSRVLTATKKNWKTRPVCKIKPFGFSRGWTVTPDHRVWAIKDAAKRNRRGPLINLTELNKLEPAWIPAGELTKSDVLVIERPKRKGTESPEGFEIHSGSSNTGSTETVDWCPELARFVGYWLAEGSIHKAPSKNSPNKEFLRIQFSVSTEDEWLDDLQGIIASLFGRGSSYDEAHPGETKEARIAFGQTLVGKWLRETFSKGAENKEIPIEILEKLDDDCLANLLIGWLRGDGCSVSGTRGCGYVIGSTISPKLASAFYYIGLRLGLVPSIELKDGPVYLKAKSNLIKNRKPLYNLLWGGEHAETLKKMAFAWIPYKEVKHRTRRVWVDENRIYTGIREIENSVYTGEVYDLGIEKDPSFLVPGSHIHNSLVQAQVVYDYTLKFWKQYPRLANDLLDGDPTLTQTRLKTGVTLSCLTSSERQVRGKHVPGLIIDEGSQNSPPIERSMQAAVQGPMSEKNHCISIVSTFHIPLGFFQEAWDSSKERGFKRYKWGIYETMETCPPEVPCEGCYLNDKGNDNRYAGCNGIAKESVGFLPFEVVEAAKRMNEGTSIFPVEYENQRPRMAQTIYPEEQVLASVRSDIIVPKMTRVSVGIDWGMEEAAIVVAARLPEHVAILEVEYLHRELVGSVVDILMRIEKTYGKVKVYGDAANAYNNEELAVQDFDITPVSFKRWKDFGIQNIQRYFASGRIIIRDTLSLYLMQLKEYRRTALGKILKRNDHAADATLCAMMEFPFIDEFGSAADGENGESFKSDTNSSVLLLGGETRNAPVNRRIPWELP